MRIEEWAARYAQAWQGADGDAAGALFTEDATYRSDPFGDARRGRDAIRSYWREATAAQANIEVKIGRIVADGSRAVVEWWAQMDSDGTPATLPGALILDFDESGLCRALREYYNLEVGRRIPPPDDWGT